MLVTDLNLNVTTSTGMSAFHPFRTLGPAGSRADWYDLNALASVSGCTCTMSEHEAYPFLIQDGGLLPGCSRKSLTSFFT